MCNEGERHSDRDLKETNEQCTQERGVTGEDINGEVIKGSRDEKVD